MATSTIPTSQPSSNPTSTTARGIPSRPATPLRPLSRTSLRASQTTPTAAGASHGSSHNGGGGTSDTDFPLLALEPAFSEFSDSMADLEANMMHLQLLTESLTRFNESFGAFLYGLNMSAFCVDFPEAPTSQSFTRHKDTHTASSHRFGYAGGSNNNNNSGDTSIFPTQRAPPDAEATFLTSDTSFVENPPPTSSKPASKFSSVPSSTASAASAGYSRGRGGGGGTAGSRGRSVGGASGIARGSSTRGGSRGSRGGSGIARGVVGRGRGVVGRWV